MARRPQVRGSALWRRAVVADMRQVQRHFPTPWGAARLADVEAGDAVLVSAGRLLRGLARIDPGTAELFRAVPGRPEAWFLLDEDDTLTEQAPLGSTRDASSSRLHP